MERKEAYPGCEMHLNVLELMLEYADDMRDYGQQVSGKKVAISSL